MLVLVAGICALTIAAVPSFVFGRTRVMRQHSQRSLGFNRIIQNLLWGCLS